MNERVKHLGFTVSLTQALTAALLVGAVPQSYADTGSDALEEVIVTAQRQGAVKVQDAALAISVVNPQTLTREGATDYDDYLGSLPSVALDQTGPGQNKFTIRGLTTGTFNATDTQDRTLVSVYLDDTPISIQGNTPDLSVLDLERVEVVRGPQGTLYGAGAMAGNVRLVTVKPDSHAVSGDVDSSVTNTVDGTFGYATRAMVNVPLIEGSTALRAAVYHVQESGYIDNIGLGESHANDDRRTQARVALRFQPDERLTVDGSFTYSNLLTGGLNDTLTGLGFSYQSNIPERYRDNVQIFNATIAYDLGAATASSSTSFINRGFGLLYSWQYALHRYLYKSLTDEQTQGIIAPDDIGNRLRDFDEEVRITSRQDQPLRWMLGGYFQHEIRNYTQDIVNPGIDALEGPGYTAADLGAPVADDLYHGTQNVYEKNRAAFGEVNYDIVPHYLTATAGLRYFDWDQDFNLYQGGLFGVIYPDAGAPFPLTSTGHAHETGTNPRFALSSKITDSVLLFAEAAKGFRYGGVNYPLPNTCAQYGNAPSTFQPDHLWSYQLGEKSAWIDKRLTVNLTAFFVNWSNVQTTKVDTSCSYYFIVAGGKVESRGVELETTMRVTPQLSLALNASYTSATADGALPNIGAVSGERTPYTPEVIASASVNYQIPLGINHLDLMFNWRYRSDEHTDFDAAQGDYFVLPIVSQGNLALTYVAPSYEIGLFGRNITNEKEVLSETTNYNSATITNFGDRLYYGRTATYGLRGEYKF